MKKIGIITMYYKSINYGGVLQAYALERYLNSIGMDAEQICFSKGKKNLKTNIKKKIKENGFKWLVLKFRNYFGTKIGNILLSQNEKKLFEERRKKFENFRNQIKHSKKVYTCDNIAETNDIYDIFCCGSDQIWKPGVVCDEYLLKFVKNKEKISYAASISKTNISEDELKTIADNIKDYMLISLREETDVSHLNQLIKKKVEWVVDPTLLLEENDWNNIASQRQYEGDYIFCYTLELNSKKKKAIKKFSKSHFCKIITIPYANGTIDLKEKNFGDIKIINAGPEDFLSLIKHAKYIITDSFHASLFSIMFKKDFFVLERYDAPTMNSRIISLLNLFGLKERFVKENDLNTIKTKCNYCNISQFNKIRENSINFLNKIK